MASKAQEWILKRKALGLPLSPTMQRGTIEYFRQKSWSTMKQRTCNSDNFNLSGKYESYKRKGICLEMDRDSFYAWVSDNWQKIKSLYDEGNTPSIDRIDNNKGYFIGNIQILDLFTNTGKDRKKPVTGINEKTGETVSFESAVDATRLDSRFRCNKQISTAIKRNTRAYGFRWKFSG